MMRLNMTVLKNGLLKPRSIQYVLLFSLTAVALAGCDVGNSTSQDVSDPGVSATQEPSQAVCSNCGTVTSITPVSVKGDGTGAGAAIGAVVGGLLGHQVGGGSGKDAATVVGVVGGAVAGNEIEKRSKQQTYYEVVVKMDQGGTQTAQVYSADKISVGTPVKVVGNNLELQ